MFQNISFDGKIDIAIGKYRYESRWKNRKVNWSYLLSRFSKVYRTPETYNEYLNLKRDRQDEIKDIGGFVGGYLTSGIRNSHSVLHKQLITLDIDFANTKLWKTFIKHYDCAAAMYTTHKHSAASPRLRLVLPLSRPVNTEEYIAISRRIAGTLDIELFDVTTFQPERLMYWPSASSDGEFIFEYQDGIWLCADTILDSYINWQDSSEWPQSEREDNIHRREMKKQGDPLEKPGIIGTFCRAYGMQDAIAKFLVDAYEPCAMDDRYTYKEGSTSAGLIVYEDKFAYSHHGTDPASHKLCNAFDLVRIHMFGLLDENSKIDEITKLPSYKAMKEFAAKDKRVKQHIGRERIASVKEDFKDVELPAEDEEEINNVDWTEKLDVDKSGLYYSTINNVYLILENDPHLKGAFARDLFRSRDMVLRSLPWRKVKKKPDYFNNADDAGLRHYLERVYGIVSTPKINDALRLVAEKNGYHPIKDYVSSVEWDGTPRVETLLMDYLGAENSEYVRIVTRKTLCAAISRIYNPGCKFDYMLVLVGPQGIQKSTLFARLAGNWFSDSLTTVTGKEAFEQLQGAWIIEVPELSAFKRSEVETIKHYISKPVDQYRPAYAKQIEIYPRQSIFIGSTNESDFLKDLTGNRRFWPVNLWTSVPTKNVFEDLGEAERGQIWAEAYQIYLAGETLYLSADVEDTAKQIQMEHTEKDDWVDIIEPFLNMNLPEDWYNKSVFERIQYINDPISPEGIIPRKKACNVEIWVECLEGRVKDLTPAITRRITNCVKQVKGWYKNAEKMRFKPYGLQRGYKKFPAAVPKTEKR